MKIKTVMINRNGSPVVINASDFRYGSDVIWQEGDRPVVQAEPVKAEPVKATTADVKITHKGGGRWMVEVNGHKAHDNFLTKAEAAALAGQY